MTIKGVRIGEGRTAEIFAWGNDRVVKLYRPEFPPSEAESETRIAEAVQAAKLPAPAYFGIVEVEGRPGLVFERVQGPSMLSVLVARPWLVGRLSRLLAQLHVQLHTAQVDLSRFPSAHENLEYAIRNANTLPPSYIEAALQRLSELPEGVALCHGDFHPGNVILAPDRPLILDWAIASRGSPFADLARTSLLFRAGQIELGPFKRLLIDLLRSRVHTGYLRVYDRLQPGAAQAMLPWRLPVIAARFYENISGERDLLLRLLADDQ